MATTLSPFDPCSFAQPNRCEVKHIHMCLNIDFEKHVLSGSVNLQIERNERDVNSIILDTRGLQIHGVTSSDGEQNLNFSLDEPVKPFGARLDVQLPTTNEERCSITITYETSPECSALQWLKPEHTAGKKLPYLFSQCQAIHARSVLPCQDTPAVKMTYSAEISAVQDLTVLMSAVRQGSESCTARPDHNVHRFDQKVPVPSCLITIVAGALVSRDIGPRSKVWTEAEMLDAAAFEFAETEDMLKLAEELLGPYVWGVYDLLVPPPTFPYEGMENPCINFMTPTLLAGDRSLVNSHEIIHSWTGNLVTNRNPEHFWLNEGHTVFIERKIGGLIHGEKHRHFEMATGYRELKDNINEVYGGQHPLTRLVPCLAGVNPDDAFSLVPYEKGATLLFYLEQLVGGAENFDPFLRAYIEKFKYRSITTDDWKDFLLSFFKGKVDEGVFDQVDWNAWLYNPGMPPVKPDYNTTLSDACSDLRKRWAGCHDNELDQFNIADLQDFSSLQVVEFLTQLLHEDQLSAKKIHRMADVYQMDNVRNFEIKFRWLRLCIRARIEEYIQEVFQFLNEVGRMKYARPLYRDLYNWTISRNDAVSNYKNHKRLMHPLTASMVGKDLQLK